MMRNWGVGLVILGALAVVGLISDPKAEDTNEGMIGAVIFLGGGSLLAYKGQKYIDSMREISEESLQQIREKDYIDALALSKKFQISEIEIRQKITKAQNKKFIPFGVDIK